MKMRSTKIKTMAGTAIETPGDGYFPSLNLMEKSVPELGEKKIGDTCKLCMEVKIRGIRRDNSGINYDCEIQSVGYMDEKEEKAE